MKSEDRVLRALEALRRADRNKKAPARVEDKLLAAYRSRQREPGSSRWQLVAAVAAAALVAVLVGRLYSERREMVHPNAASAWKPAPAVTVVRHAQASAAPSVLAVARKRNVVQVQEAPREIVTDFFPLMDVAPPLGRGELLRVAVPASAMRSVGLPVREDRLDEPVQADVLIGEEGMVRAIRFVSLLR
jgi:hypothetical protein